MWQPKYSGDFKTLYGKKIIVTYGYDGEKNSIKTEGILTRMGKNSDNVLSSVILDIKNNNNHNHNYISSNTICCNLISNIDIECDDVEEVIKEESEKSLCLDVSNIILEFSGKYISL